MNAAAAPILPAETPDSGAPNWWGMVIFITTDVTLFIAFLFSYFYLRSGAPQWPPDGIKRPDLTIAIIETVVLLSSSLPMLWADAAIKRGRQGQLRAGLALVFLLGVAFILLELLEWSKQPFSLSSSIYGSLYFAILGFHGLHVLTGLYLNLNVQLRAWLGHFTADRRQAVTLYGLYWHFVDIVWIFIFLSLYISPHVLGK